MRKNLHFEIRNRFSGHQVTSSSALPLPALICVSKQIIWRNIQFQNSYQSLRKSTLPLKNDCTSGIEGGDYWAAGKSSHLQFFSPKNMCFEHEAISSNLRIQPRFIFCFYSTKTNPNYLLSSFFGDLLSTSIVQVREESLHLQFWKAAIFIQSPMRLGSPGKSTLSRWKW